jgi:predicted metal-dependent hydrolase
VIRHLIKAKPRKEPDFPYEVIRTDRKKSATIKVEEGKVLVVIPKSLSPKRLEILLHEKTPWIHKKLHEYSLVEPVKPKEYVSGECFTYLGRNYRLKLTGNDSGDVKLKGGQFVLGVDAKLSGDEKTGFVRDSLLEWYFTHAKEKLEEKTRRYAKVIGVEPKSVMVKSYKSRWGSCSSKGDISYNWKIIIAPHRVVDYVVIHELSHMLHHNHSDQFWQSVQRFIPDYQEYREWLKLNGSKLIV